MNLFFPTNFPPKTLSQKLDFCLMTLMNFNVLEFKADFRNRIFYALNVIYQYHFILISSFTHVAALLLSYCYLYTLRSALSFSRENGGQS